MARLRLRVEIARLSVFRHNLDRWAVVFPDPWPRMILHVVLALAVWFLPPMARRSRRYAVRLAGEIYLPFIFPLFYAEMAELGLVFHDFNASLDPWFIQLEERIFGFQPSLEWARAWPWPVLHELMEFAYFTYYFIPFTVLFLILRGRGIPDSLRWGALRDFIRDQGATMLICYTIYTLFPVWGPKYFRAGFVEVDGWIFTDIMRHIHSTQAILGAAFPSSHVAATLVPWWHVWRWFPQHRAWMTTLFVLLCLSTVYCRYHYVVDVMGGLLLGTLIIAIGERNREAKPAGAFAARAEAEGA
jgi:membrane-associated phospholipid phosphatase